MGFYLRKSARFGPFRINFSTSGIGVSAGIRGLRLGVGPRGAYVHAGVGGLYYRQSLGAIARPEQRYTQNPQPSDRLPPIANADRTLGVEQVIESGSVLQMNDSTGSGLVEELDACRKRLQMSPWVAAIAGVLGLSALSQSSAPLGVIAMAALVLAYWAHIKDIERKGFVLQYELDEGAGRAAAALVETCEKIQGVRSSWYMNATRDVIDRRYHAGAARVIRRSSARLQMQEPPYLKTNVPVPSIPLGTVKLYFLPDRLLVYAGSNVGAVAYRDLKIEVRNQRFIEDGMSSVPSDAEVVDTTWRYVNKDGSADRRFKNNTQLPIVLYEEIAFFSDSGLRGILQLSKRGIGIELKRSIVRLNDAIAKGKLAANRQTEAPVVRPKLLPV